jgi:2-methylfumaryl-CoA isomerase
VDPVAAPLSGLHIIDASSFVAGPSCTMTLAQLGADVLRVDPLGGGADLGRHPLAEDGTSLYWNGLNKGKRVVQTNLRTDEGRSAIARLIATPGDGHGIVVTNAVGPQGLQYDELLRHRPDLIFLHLEGRADGTSAVDYTINCETGLPGITGPAQLGEPVNSVLPSWDLLTGLHAAVALLAGWRRRSETGEGALIRISLADVAAATLSQLGYVADAVLNDADRKPDGNGLYGTYGQDFNAADGRRIMLVALTTRHWLGLVEACQLTSAVQDLERSTGRSLRDEGERYAARHQITALLRPWFASRSFADVTASLDAARVPWGEYQTITHMATAPDGLVARSAIFDPGPDGYPVPRSVARTTAWKSASTPPPTHTALEQVLADWSRTTAAVTSGGH